ncbi:MAG TPA: transposase [Polyangiaceae bacterium]|jgi:transposase-like protein|nr:transposase [Polyangiaceae bacterium]
MRKRLSVKTYNEAFRKDALTYLERSKGTFAGVAGSLGIPEHTLYTWYRLDTKAKTSPRTRRPRGSDTPESDVEKLVRLEAENRKLREQVASLEGDKIILKKFAAFSIRENARDNGQQTPRRAHDASDGTYSADTA